MGISSKITGRYLSFPRQAGKPGRQNPSVVRDHRLAERGAESARFRRIAALRAGAVAGGFGGQTGFIEQFIALEDTLFVPWRRRLGRTVAALGSVALQTARTICRGPG